MDIPCAIYISKHHDMKLSAEKGNLVLDMKCEVYFTNPTDVEWNITNVTMDARVLKTQSTKDLTIEPTKTIITHTVPPRDIGEIKLEFHDTIASSGVLGKVIKLGELDDANVPVQASFTVYVNNKPAVIDSQGKEWYLGYTAHTEVKIVTDGDRVAEDITTDLIANVATDAIIGAAIGNAVLPGIGTVPGAIVGAVFGLVTNFVGGYVLHDILGIP